MKERKERERKRGERQAGGRGREWARFDHTSTKHERRLSAHSSFQRASAARTTGASKTVARQTPSAAHKTGARKTPHRSTQYITHDNSATRKTAARKTPHGEWCFAKRRPHLRCTRFHGGAHLRPAPCTLQPASFTLAHQKIEAGAHLYGACPEIRTKDGSSQKDLRTFT